MHVILSQKHCYLRYFCPFSYIHDLHVLRDMDVFKPLKSQNGIRLWFYFLHVAGTDHPHGQPSGLHALSGMFSHFV